MRISRTNLQRLAKSSNKDELLEKLATTAPIDEYVNVRNDITFSLDASGVPLINSDTMGELRLSKRAFSQLSYSLHPKLSPALLEAMPIEEAEGVMNNFIHRAGTEMLFRRTPNNVVVGVLSKTYRTVNHEVLIDTVQQIPNDIYFESFVNYEIAIVRTAIKEISSEGLGTWAGIHFVNGQVGNLPLAITALLWEKICTNGAILQRGSFEYFRGRHTKHMRMPDGSILSWFEDITDKVVSVYDEARYVEIRREYIENLPKKYNLITQKLAGEFIDHIALQSGRTVSFEKATLWQLIQAVTQKSQQFAPERRLMLDSFTQTLLGEHGIRYGR